MSLAHISKLTYIRIKTALALKNLIKNLTHWVGYHISQHRDPYQDIKSNIKSDTGLIIFDVGANTGQTITRLRKNFAHSQIHVFEPARDLFKALELTYSSCASIYLNQCALGAVSGTQEFKEAGATVMSSLLEPAQHGWDGKGWTDIKCVYPVSIKTVDGYCAENNIEAIDILKTDTQGYDLEVLKGAERMLRGRRIRFIYLEINFDEMYEGQASFDDIYRFLSDRGFELRSPYEVHARYMDCLFVNSR
jgi:FkbM family methyltransferase